MLSSLPVRFGLVVALAAGVAAPVGAASAAAGSGVTAGAVAPAEAVSCSVSASGTRVTVTISPAPAPRRGWGVSRRQENGYKYKYLGRAEDATFVTSMQAGDDQVIQIESRDGQHQCGEVDVAPLPDEMTCSASAVGSQLTVTIQPSPGSPTRFAVSLRAFPRFHYEYRYLGATTETTFVTTLREGNHQEIQVREIYADGSRSLDSFCGEVDITPLPGELTCSVLALGPQAKVTISPSGGAAVAFAVSRKPGSGYSYQYLATTTHTTVITPMDPGARQLVQVREVYADGSRSPNVFCGLVYISS